MSFDVGMRLLPHDYPGFGRARVLYRAEGGKVLVTYLMLDFRVTVQDHSRLSASPHGVQRQRGCTVKSLSVTALHAKPQSLTSQPESLSIGGEKGKKERLLGSIRGLIHSLANVE